MDIAVSKTKREEMLAKIFIHNLFLTSEEFNWRIPSVIKKSDTESDVINVHSSMESLRIHFC